MIKKLLLILFGIFITVNCYATDYTADPNCVMSFLMDIDESPLTDSTDSFSGVLKGAGEPDYSTTSPPASYTPGFYDSDGSDDYVSITASTEYGNANMTVVFWYLLDAYGQYDAVMAQEDSFALSMGDSQNTGGVVAVFNDSGGVRQTYTTTYDWSGSWAHYAVTFNAATNAITIYVNGVSQTTGSTSGWSVNNGFTADRLYLFSWTSASNQSNGKMCEFALFNDILTSDEIIDIYTNGLEGVATTRRVMIIQ